MVNVRMTAAACDRETPSRVSTGMAECNTQPFPVNNQLNQYSREIIFLSPPLCNGRR